jgi:hypothetical protein
VRRRQPDERPDRLDATYTPGHLGDLDAGRDGGQEAPIRALLAFVKERQKTRKAADPPSRR